MNKISLTTTETIEGIKIMVNSKENNKWKTKKTIMIDSNLDVKVYDKKEQI